MTKEQQEYYNRLPDAYKKAVDNGMPLEAAVRKSMERGGTLNIPGQIASERIQEQSTMTNPIEGAQQFWSVINGLFPSIFPPKAHDAINNIIGENEYTLEQIQSGQVGEERLPSLAPEQLQNNAMLDSLLGRRAQGWPPGPNVMSSPFFKKSYNESNVGSLIEALMRSQGEFGAAQPVSPRQMPR